MSELSREDGVKDYAIEAIKTMPEKMMREILTEIICRADCIDIENMLTEYDLRPS